MTELHPYKSFVPENSSYLILGSFPGKPEVSNDWFYGAKRNQFWKIMEAVYKKDLSTKANKKELLSTKKIALSDVILKCDRKKNSNSDTNLCNITYNTKEIIHILQNNRLNKIFFTSRFVEKIFNKLFPDFDKTYPKIKMVTLPSPSPRYAILSLSDKIRQYKKLLT